MEKKSYRTFFNIKTLNYNRKITLFLISVVLIAAMLILITVSFSAGETIKKKSAELALQQIESITGNLETAFANFSDVATYVISDNRVQTYLRTSESNSDNYTQLTNNAYLLLTYLISSNSYLDYVCVYKKSDDSILYQGQAWTIPNFKEKMKERYAIHDGVRLGSMRFLTEPSFFRDNDFSMNIYQPISDFYNLNQEIGALLISINHERFSSIYAVDGSELPFEIYLTDADGIIISSADTMQIGQVSPFAKELKSKSGSFEAEGNMMLYNRMGEWDWYVVGSIPMSYLLKDNRNTMRIMIVFIAAICIVAPVLCYNMSNRLYQPLGELVENMSKISKGNLSIRMDNKYNGEDIEKINDGFNHMLDQIEMLMVKIKDEQHQIEQIKFNALQSQIKPHFLYNTLECIHWQAVADGNKEVSTMVKALATFYRLCLSKGKDLIPLEQEIAHVKSYLIIQNMRYDGIVESDFIIDGTMEHVLIPKMTLQPLVENSIYHGIKPKSDKKGKITIRVIDNGIRATILVEDTGVGMEQNLIDEMNNSISIYDESFGYGVRNVHKRIELVFGKEYGLYYRKNETGGMTVEINLPQERGSVRERILDVQDADSR